MFTLIVLVLIGIAVLFLLFGKVPETIEKPVGNIVSSLPSTSDVKRVFVTPSDKSNEIEIPNESVRKAYNAIVGLAEIAHTTICTQKDMLLENLKQNMQRTNSCFPIDMIKANKQQYLQRFNAPDMGPVPAFPQVRMESFSLSSVNSVVNPMLKKFYSDLYDAGIEFAIHLNAKYCKNGVMDNEQVFKAIKRIADHVCSSSFSPEQLTSSGKYVLSFIDV